MIYIGYSLGQQTKPNRKLVIRVQRIEPTATGRAKYIRTKRD